MTATTDRTSEVTGESIANNLSFVRDEIAGTAAKIDEQQVAALARNLCQHTLEAGSAAFFPIGWKGTWEIQEQIRKFFVIFAA